MEDKGGRGRGGPGRVRLPGNSRGTSLLALLMVICSGIVVVVTYAGFAFIREKAG